jgi:hypothetical protein
MELDPDFEQDTEPNEPKFTPNTTGGKSAAAQPGVHKTVAAMGPAALPVDAPVKQEPPRELDTPKVPVDERQIARLATGAAVDVDAFTEVSPAITYSMAIFIQSIYYSQSFPNPSPHFSKNKKG